MTLLNDALATSKIIKNSNIHTLSSFRVLFCDQTIHLSRQLTKSHLGYSREYDQDSNFFSKNIFVPHSNYWSQNTA